MCSVFVPLPFPLIRPLKGPHPRPLLNNTSNSFELRPSPLTWRAFSSVLSPERMNLALCAWREPHNYSIVNFDRSFVSSIAVTLLSNFEVKLFNSLVTTVLLEISSPYAGIWFTNSMALKIYSCAVSLPFILMISNSCFRVCNLISITFEVPWNLVCKIVQACFDVLAVAIHENSDSCNDCWMRNKALASCLW